MMLSTALLRCARLKCTCFPRFLTSGNLPWTVTRYNAVSVELKETCKDFSVILADHLKQWREEGRSAVWLTVPIALTPLIPSAADLGFTFHHTKSSEVVLSCWLQEERKNRLPPYGSHQVGVCGIVYREDSGALLVTQDKHKPAVWKFPGGLAEVGEDIADAAVREVKEETGIDTDFRSILAFRHQHRLKHYFDLSDLYFLCRLDPLTFDLTPCPDEIVKCEWWPLDELLACPQITPLTRKMVALLLEARDDGPSGNVEIVSEDCPMLISGWTPDKTYKLFRGVQSSNCT